MESLLFYFLTRFFNLTRACLNWISFTFDIIRVYLRCKMNFGWKIFIITSLYCFAFYFSYSRKLPESYFDYSFERFLLMYLSEPKPEKNCHQFKRWETEGEGRRLLKYENRKGAQNNSFGNPKRVCRFRHALVLKRHSKSRQRPIREDIIGSAVRNSVILISGLIRPFLRIIVGGLSISHRNIPRLDYILRRSVCNTRDLSTLVGFKIARRVLYFLSKKQKRTLCSACSIVMSLSRDSQLKDIKLHNLAIPRARCTV